jgi:hypothetical protein
MPQYSLLPMPKVLPMIGAICGQRCCPQDPAWREKQRPEAEQNSVDGRQIGYAAPTPVDDQELLLHEEAVGHNRSCATGSQELGDRG